MHKLNNLHGNMLKSRHLEGKQIGRCVLEAC